MDTETIRQRVLEASGAGELYSVIAAFKGYREHKTEGQKEIVVEVRDLGNDSPDRLRPYRYVVRATDEDGRVATGNGGATVDEAIATTHWHELDGRPRARKRSAD